MTHVRRALRRERLRRGWTFARVADGVQCRGVLRQILVVWESGTAGRSPSDVQLEAWAAALGLRLQLVEACPGAEAIEVLTADEVRLVLEHRRARPAEAA